MKKIQIKALLFLFTIAVFLSSCDSDEDVTPNPISIKPLNFTIKENPLSGAIIGEVTLETPVSDIIFSLGTQNPTNALAINSSSGELTVADSTKFDFEVNEQISFEVIATQGSSSSIATGTITLTDVEDAQITTTNFETTIAENPLNGTSLGTVTASSDQGSVTFNIKEGEFFKDAFAINNNTGELTVADSSFFDFEEYDEINVLIEVKFGEITQTTRATITLTNIANPVINQVLWNDLATNAILKDDTFTIEGENFGSNPDAISVYLSDGTNTEELEIISSSLPNSILLKKNASTLNQGRLVVKANTEESLQSNVTYSFVEPLSIDEVSYTGKVGTNVTITGTSIQVNRPPLTPMYQIVPKGDISEELELAIQNINTQLISISESEFTIRVPAMPANSVLKISNGLQEVEIDFEVEWPVSFSEIIGFPVRAEGEKGDEVNIQLTNISPEMSENSITLTRKIDGAVFKPEIIRQGNPQFVSDTEFRNQLYFNLPDEIGLYEVEVSVNGKTTAAGDYSVYAHENNTIGFISAFTYDSEIQEMSVFARPRFAWSNVGISFDIELLDLETKEVVYSKKFDGSNGSSQNGIFKLITEAFVPPGGEYLVRVKRTAMLAGGDVVDYTPVSYDTIRFIY